MFTEIKMQSFTEKELNSLRQLFNILDSDKRLKILTGVIVDNVTQLPELAKNLNEPSYKKLIIHIKKLCDYGFLGRVEEADNELQSLAPEETYIFLKIASLFDNIVRTRMAERQLTQLKDDTKKIGDKIATSPIKNSISDLVEVTTPYDETLKHIQEISYKLIQKYKNTINAEEL